MLRVSDGYGHKRYKVFIKIEANQVVVVCTPLIPALGGQKQVDFCEFKASLVYIVSSRTARTVTQRPCLKKINQLGWRDGSVV